ncbi:MAG: hypothetical protein OJF51_003446 [Nitrospira sp.]|nr:MAG: hypothetical protein OJF51_003446 [Nitrospira sp.]
MWLRSVVRSSQRECFEEAGFTSDERRISAYRRLKQQCS